VLAGLLLTLLPRGIKRPERAPDRSIRSAFKPDLLRLDLYIFLLHVLLTASFVALPFVLRNQLDLALTAHWKIYIGAVLASLLGTVPLIIKDERQGKATTLGLAITLLLVGQLLLAFAGHTTAGRVFRRLQFPGSRSAGTLIHSGNGRFARRLAGCVLQLAIPWRICWRPARWILPVGRQSSDCVCGLRAAVWNLAYVSPIGPWRRINGQMALYPGEIAGNRAGNWRVRPYNTKPAFFT